MKVPSPKKMISKHATAYAMHEQPTACEKYLLSSPVTWRIFEIFFLKYGFL